MGLGIALAGAFTAGFPDDPLGAVAAVIRSQFGVGGTARDDDGHRLLTFPFHPAAEDLEVSLSEAGVLEVSAKTSTAGPGYHVRVVEVLDAVASALGVRWEAGEEGGDDTGYLDHRDPAELERQMLEWLRALARHLADEEDRGIDVCLPLECGFLLDADTRTALGPRDRAWWRAAAVDPRAGVEFFPWWEPGEGAGYWRGLALALMWSDVRWAPPRDEDEERTHRRVLDALARSHELDPSIPLPWREWAELLELGDEPEPRAAEVRGRAALAPPGPPAGYLRDLVRVPLTGGWSIVVPGVLHRSWDEEGTFCASGGGRTVWFSSLTLRRRGEAGRPDLDELRRHRPEEAVEAHERDEDGLVGAAWLRPYEEDGEPGWMLATETAAPGRLGLATVCFERREDRDWALETWRSLALAGGEEEPDP
jgi:hypothetical protein